MPKKKAADANTLIAFPDQTLSKTQIEAFIEGWLNDRLIEEDPAPLYVKIKQIEAAVKAALDRLNAQAFEDAGMKFGGLSAGTIAGQKVELTYPKKWIYSEKIFALEEEQKTALDIAKKREQIDGIAHQEPQKGIMRVSIKTQ
jgi:hypothetical protein